MIFGRILVAVDGGAPSARAAAAAYTLAAELKSEIRLFHAVEPPTAAAQTGMSPEEVTKLIEGESEQIFSSLLGFLPASVSPQRLSGAGDPANEILRAAADWRADLLVMGSHGRDGVMRVLLGSVAEKVMRHATCPVLVIKAAEMIERS